MRAGVHATGLAVDVATQIAVISHGDTWQDLGPILAYARHARFRECLIPFLIEELHVDGWIRKELLVNDRKVSLFIHGDMWVVLTTGRSGNTSLRKEVSARIKTAEDHVVVQGRQ